MWWGITTRRHIQRIHSVFPCLPLVVDLTNRKFNILAVFVVIPQALFLEGLR